MTVQYSYETKTKSYKKNKASNHSHFVKINDDVNKWAQSQASVTELQTMRFTQYTNSPQSATAAEFHELL